MMASYDDLMEELRQAAKVHTPTPDELASSPRVLNWGLEMLMPGTLVLVGVVLGHPRLPDGPVTTSLLRAIDVEAGWTRTHNRYYRLGYRREKTQQSPYDPLVAEIRSIVGAIGADRNDLELELWARHGSIFVDSDGLFSSPNTPTGRLPPRPDDDGDWTIDRRELAQLLLRVASARAQRWRVDEQRLLPMPETWREALKLHGGNRFAREVSVGAGWVDTILAVDGWLIELGHPTGWDQIKEKFASIRMYPATEVTGFAADIIQHAETVSQWICETCGAPGYRRNRDGWMYTSCDEHAQGAQSG